MKLKVRGRGSEGIDVSHLLFVDDTLIDLLQGIQGPNDTLVLPSYVV